MEEKVKEFDSLIELLEDLDRVGITGIDRRRHMNNFLLRKSRLHGRPYCASFELTPLCNFDCKMCYMHLTKEQMTMNGRILTTAEWLDIVRQAVDAGVACVDLTGGECLTHPGFVDIYMYLIERGVEISVLTNGQLITDRLIGMFVEHPPVTVQISLYGSCSEAYLRVTGRDAFEDVMSAVHRLKAAGIKVVLSLTPNRFMQEDAENLLDLIHSLNVDYSIGRTTLPARPETGRDIENYIIDNAAYLKICEMESAHRARLAEELSLKRVVPYDFRIRGQNRFEGAPCSAGSAYFHINWKGEMTPCIAYYTVTKSVLTDGVESAWEWIRNQMLQYRIPEQCIACKNRKNCQGCCAEKTFGVLNGPVNPWVCKRCEEIMELAPKV